MHHSLKFYGQRRPSILRLYMFGARCTRIPLLGHLVRWLANRYGASAHRAYPISLAEAEELVAIAEGVALGPCDCRKVFRHCDNPVEVEILLGPTRHVFIEAKPHDAREITKETARDILQASHRRGLIPTIIKCRGDFYAICSCCTCCCVPLRLKQQYGIGKALVRHSDIVREFREYQARLVQP
jgi:hypothetical protein